MIITRDNYEEFFLLYVDKELDADGRAAVEVFASLNPDLAKELELLQQVILVKDNSKFPGKEQLLKKESSISISNYEEYFLLSADNELTEEQGSEVENFILKHPEVQEEFTLLQKTRLQPEVIAFKGKEKLYRKERRERRIIPLRLVKISAAAAILGIAYISFIFIDNKGREDIAAEQFSPGPVKIVLKKNDSGFVQKIVPEKAVRGINDNHESSSDLNKSIVKTGIVEKRSLRKIKEVKEQEKTTDNIKEKETQIQIAQPNLAIVDPEDEVPVEAEPTGRSLNQDKFSEVKDEKSFVIEREVGEEERALFTNAVYLETDNVEQEKSLYIGIARLNKNKAKGFLRKAVALFDKKVLGNDD